jgi:hypothetical protein
MSQAQSLEAQSSVLFSYPAKAAFGRTLPKNKIYEHSGANTRLKTLFVKQVEQVVWQYKLAPDTINLPASAAVPEIQIFSMHLKTREVADDVLRCLDAAVQYPLLFELHHAEQVQMKACYKRPNAADASKWVLSDYFASPWLPTHSPRTALPIALNLALLYEQLLRGLLPLPARPQETLAALVERVSAVRNMQRELEQTQQRLTRERQFNRKVEINAQVRELTAALAQLIGGGGYGKN